MIQSTRKLYQLISNVISRPTRITNTSATLTDKIFVNDINENFRCGIFFTDISDHLILITCNNNVKDVRETTCFRLFEQALYPG